MKLLSAASLASAMLFLCLTWTLPHSAWLQGFGILVELGAAILFFEALQTTREAHLRLAFDPCQPASIIITGPYKHVRHPFYASYVMFWMGWAFAISTGWALLPVLFLAAFYLIAALREERLFEASRFAAEYAAYRNDTGLFWPRLWKWR
ncbi:isoprenylcysteine carboxylmethyltransferase family protein [Bradyrhizobium sp. UFLA05-109]